MITNQKQEHSAGHFLFLLVQTGRNHALRSRLMEQALFAVRMILKALPGHVNPDSSAWEVAMNSKRAFVVLEGPAAKARSLLDPV